MARFGKPLAVAAFALCVLFFGFAAAVTLGGPNWRAYGEDLPAFQIAEVGEGADVRYGVIDRVTNSTVTTADSLPAAVVAAYREQTTRLRAEKAEREERVAAIEQAIPRDAAANRADTAAMDARLEGLRTAYADATRQLLDATAAGAEASRKAGGVRAVAGTRAEDLERLRGELDAVRADLFRTNRQIDALRDLEVRLNGALARAERRREQLAERTD